MPGYQGDVRHRAALVQAEMPARSAPRDVKMPGRSAPVSGWTAPRWLNALAGWCLLLTGCSGSLGAPVRLFHDLEGGEIAALRPPPPGAGQPYPKLGTVPAKPVVADAAYRRALQAQLAGERDRTERVAADSPIEAVPPPPPALRSIAAPGAASPNPGQPEAATAMLETAEAPRAAVTAAPPMVPATAAMATGTPGDGGPPPGTRLSLAGDAPDPASLPDMPAAPPAPATFEGVAAEPAPTPQMIPSGLAAPRAGTQVFFPVSSDALPVSQTQTLRDFIARRGNRTIEILGMGDAASDTPDGQATAVALGLARARAVAHALAALHVPQAAMRLGADAFGRGAVLRLLP